MSELFGAEFFRGNRAKLRALFHGKAPIIIAANGQVQRNGDVSLPFRQDSNFWYLTGINEPDILLVLDKNKEYLIVPEREEVRQIFEGSIDLKALAQSSGIREVLSTGEGWARLKSRLEKAKHLASLDTFAYDDSHGLYANPARRELIERIKRINPKITMLDLRPVLAGQRQIKQSQEISALKQAAKITAKTLKKVQKKISGFKNESEIELFITNEFAKAGLTHAYTPIVASGQNACTLHYTQNNKPLKNKELVLIDVGAEVKNYASDITRVFSIHRPTRRQKQVYDAVLDIQNYAIEMLEPGLKLKAYEKQVRQRVGEKLRELGLVKTITPEKISQFYPHSTSHFLGLDVHDVGDYGAALEPGMVLTVEPGIYIPKEGIGIRIEDDVLITETGVEILSKKLPRVLV